MMPVSQSPARPGNRRRRLHRDPVATAQLRSGGQPRLPDIVKHPPKRCLWCEAHGSIRVQEPQPSCQRVHKYHAQGLTWMRTWPVPERR